MTSTRPGHVGSYVPRAGRADLRSASRFLVLLAGVFLCLGPAAAARAQVEGSAGRPLGSLSFYGMASADRNQFRNYANFPKTLGGTGGMSIDRKGLLGLTVEASGIRWRSSQVHDYTALVGPKISYRFGRFRPYGEGLVGIGRATYVVVSGLPAVHTTPSFGVAYGAAAGLDFRITHHFTWRVAQGNYTRFSVGPGVTTETGSTGIVFRFF